MKSFRLLILLVCSLAAATTARAQINVGISIKQRFHILHEPILATVTVTNQTGRDITLSDTPQYQWFGFRVTAPDDQIIPPRDLHYKLSPLAVKSGETVKRTVNLTQLYEIGDVGNFRVQASIYFDGLDRFFSSRPTYVEINEGRVLWRRVAGVPEGQPGSGQMRIFSLIAHQRGEINTLYVSVRGEDDGTTYCTFPLGRLLDGVPPQAEFDSSNNLYIMQLMGTRAYVMTKVSFNGEFLGQTNYSAPKTRPTLRKLADGTLQVIGGKREAALAQNPNAEPPPKLSDRPAGLPAN
jgi:hypothetical protein